MKRKLEKLLSVLVGPDSISKQRACAEMIPVISVLSDVLTEQDRPPWVIPLRSGLQQVANQTQGSDISAHVDDLNRFIIRNYQDIQDQRWDYLDLEDYPDFNDMFEQAFRQSRLPELFDRVVSLLRNIIESDTLDSIKLKSSLEALIKLVEKNKNKSYYSVFITVNFLSKYIRNASWEAASNFPGVGVLVRALKTTVEEMNGELASVREASEEKTNDVLNSISLPYHGSFVSAAAGLPHSGQSDGRPLAIEDAGGTGNPS